MLEMCVIWTTIEKCIHCKYSFHYAPTSFRPINHLPMVTTCSILRWQYFSYRPTPPIWNAKIFLEREWRYCLKVALNKYPTLKVSAQHLSSSVCLQVCVNIVYPMYGKTPDVGSIRHHFYLIRTSLVLYFPLFIGNYLHLMIKGQWFYECPSNQSYQLYY